VEVCVVLFDVDKTLTVRDCVIPFLRRVAGTRQLLFGVLRSSRAILRACTKRDRNSLKEQFARIVFTGKSVDEVDALGIAFAAKIANNWIRADVADRFRWHQDQGHVVVLVSASFAPYLEPFGDLVEADAVLCAELESIDGVYTGELSRPNCRGQEKVNRVRTWLAEAGLPDSSVLYAYGDSSGDTAMLDFAQTGVWVTRNELEPEPA
jgi:phosphatidylglycerophosphatase C